MATTKKGPRSAWARTPKKKKTAVKKKAKGPSLPKQLWAVVDRTGRPREVYETKSEATMKDLGDAVIGPYVLVERVRNR